MPAAQTISQRGLAPCDRCRSAIRWTVTAAGKRLPVDPEPDDAGNVAAYLTDTETWRSRVLRKGEEPAHVERRFMPHFATCSAGRQQQLSSFRTVPIPPLLLPSDVTSLDVARRRRNAARRLG